MLSNGCYNIQNLTMGSLTKVARSCCLEIQANMEYEAKVKQDIQLTHQNYMKTEQENRYLNLQVDDLDSRVKDQNYQYACLKYELEQLNRQKCDLISNLGKNPGAQSDGQFQVNKISKTNAIQKIKLYKEETRHFLDTRKLPKIFCVCGSQLKSDQILKDHIRYYNNNAKFACNLCEFKSKGLNILKTHMKRMHGVTEFTSSKGCRSCGKLFNTLSLLYQHRRREQ